MEFDFTDTTSQGFVVLPPDRYPVEVKEVWLRKKESSGNFILDIDVEVLDGAYRGEVTRYFHTIKQPVDATTKGILFGMLEACGVVAEEDRGPKRELKIEFDYGEEDENGRVRIDGIVVSSPTIGEEDRELDGAETIAVVAARESDTTKTDIVRFEAGEDTTAAPKKAEAEAEAEDDEEEEEAPAPSKSKGKSKSKSRSKKKKDVPF